jgi:hypothetical protein
MNQLMEGVQCFVGNRRVYGTRDGTYVETFSTEQISSNRDVLDHVDGLWKLLLQ